MRRSLYPALVLFALLRVPSFIEPHWYTDEAGYATTAREMLRGKLLYVGIWNNKPPEHLWTVAATLKLFGPSEAAFHALTFLASLLTLLAIAYAAARLLSGTRAALAVLAAAVLLGLPVFDAELMIPESLLIAPAAWAGALLVVRAGGAAPARLWWSVLIGVLTGLAVGYQQTALADAAAFAAILVFSPRLGVRHLGAYLAGLLGCIALWLVPALLISGPSHVAYALGGFYVPYTVHTLPASAAGRLVFGGALALVVVLALAGAFLSRRQGFAWALGLWSVATLLAAAAPRHPYAHLALPAVPATILQLAALPLPRPAVRAWWPRAAAAAPLVCAVVAAGLLARVTGVDWIPALASDGENPYRALASYYTGYVAAASGQDALNSWRSGFDYRVEPDRQVVAWLKSEGLTGHTAVVWSSDAWPYLLADLDDIMPTPPIYNNFALIDGGVGAYVRQEAPRVIVTSDAETAMYPEIMAVLRDDYREAFSAAPDHVWVLKGTL